MSIHLLKAYVNYRKSSRVLAQRKMELSKIMTKGLTYYLRVQFFALNNSLRESNTHHCDRTTRLFWVVIRIHQEKNSNSSLLSNEWVIALSRKQRRMFYKIDNSPRFKAGHQMNHLTVHATSTSRPLTEICNNQSWIPNNKKQQVAEMSKSL